MQDCGGLFHDDLFITDNQGRNPTAIIQVRWSSKRSNAKQALSKALIGATITEVNEDFELETQQLKDAFNNAMHVKLSQSHEFKNALTDIFQSCYIANTTAGRDGMEDESGEIRLGQSHIKLEDDENLLRKFLTAAHDRQSLDGVIEHILERHGTNRTQVCTSISHL